MNSEIDLFKLFLCIKLKRYCKIGNRFLWLKLLTLMPISVVSCGNIPRSVDVDSGKTVPLLASPSSRFS